MTYWTCEREAEDLCAECDRPICREHAITLKWGRPGDFLELLVCSECAAHPIKTPDRAKLT